MLKRMQWYGFCLALWLLAGILLSACEVIERTMNNPTDNPMTNLSQTFSRAEVEAFIGAPIPDSAADVHTAGEAALDTMVIARFDLPQSDLQPLLDNLGVSSALSSGYTPFFSSSPPYGEAADWWQVPEPNSTGTAYAGVNQPIDGKVYNVLVINPDADIVTVYMQVFNT